VLNEKRYGDLISGSYKNTSHYWVANYNNYYGEYIIIDLSPIEENPDPRKYVPHGTVISSKRESPEPICSKDCLDYWRNVIPNASSNSSNYFQILIINA